MAELSINIGWEHRLFGISPFWSKQHVLSKIQTPVKPSSLVWKGGAGEALAATQPICSQRGNMAQSAPWHEDYLTQGIAPVPAETGIRGRGTAPESLVSRSLKSGLEQSIGG